MSAERRIILWTVLGTAVLWCGDACVDALVFGEGTIFGQIFAPGAHELYFRLLAVAILAAGGLAWAWQAGRTRTASAALASAAADAHTLVDSYPECVVVHTEDGPLYANRALYDFLGIGGMEQLTRHTIAGIVHPDDLPRAAQRMRDLVRVGDETPPTEMRLLRSGGEYATVLIQTRLVRYLGQNARMTLFRNVTADVETRRDLVASRERLSLALEAARDGVWDWDVASGRMVYSRSWANMLGLELEDVEADQKTWERLIHPDDHQRAMSLLHAHLQGEVPIYETEVRLRHARGHYIWVLDRGKVVRRSASGEPLRMTGTHRDITDRKEAELALEVRNRLAETFLTARGGDVFRGALELVCRAMDSPAGLLGTFEPDGEMVVAAALPAANVDRIPAGALPQILARVTSNNHAVIDDGSTDIDGSGNVVQGAVAVPISTRDQVLGVLVAADRSEPYRVADRAFLESLAGYLAPILQSHLSSTRTERQLRQAQKMEALGALAGGIAHDFNNILQAVQGFTTLARSDVEQGSRLARDLDRVLKASRRGEELVRRILLFSRREESKAQPTETAAMVREAADLLRPTLPATIDLVVDMADDTGRIMADPAQFSQLLLNLATNSLHAMEPEGGTLTIRTRRLASQPDLSLPAHLAGRDLVELTVADSGCGMSPDILERLFDPFFTTKEVGKGTGLGLSVVHGIVSSHGGHVAYASEPGRGTVATIYLPRLDDEPAPAPGIDRRAAARVLFVDDEEPIVAVGRSMLERAGLRVAGCVGGQAALDLLQDPDESYDILITDAAMPGVGGDVVVARWRELKPGAPVIVVTGNEDSPILRDNQAEGRVSLLRKPFGSDSLLAAVNEILAGGGDNTDEPQHHTGRSATWRES